MRLFFLLCSTFALAACGGAHPDDSLPVDPEPPRTPRASQSSSPSNSDTLEPDAPLPGAPVPASSAAAPPPSAWPLVDTFTAATLDPRWKIDANGGDAKPIDGALHVGFPSLPGGVGRAALVTLPPVTPGAFAMRFMVRAPEDGYPARFAVGGLRRNGKLAIAVELADEGKSIVVRVRDGSASAPLALAPFVFGVTNCVTVSVDATGRTLTATARGGVTKTLALASADPIDGAEVGLTYDAGANAGASMGAQIDDVFVGPSVAACP